MSCHILLICLLGIVTITEGQPSSLLATLLEVEGMDRGGWLNLMSSMWLPPPAPSRSRFSRSALAPLAFFLLAVFLHPSQPESFFCCSFCVDHHHLLCLKSVPTLASSSPSRLLILPCFFSTSLHSQGFTHPNKPTVYSSDSPGGPWKPHPVCSGMPLAYPWDLSFNRYPLVLEEGVDA